MATIQLTEEQIDILYSLVVVVLDSEEILLTDQELEILEDTLPALAFN